MKMYLLISARLPQPSKLRQKPLPKVISPICDVQCSSFQNGGRNGCGTNTTIRIDSDVKEQANEVFEELGLSMPTAVNIFLRAVISHKCMPLDMVVYENKENEE